MDKQIDTLVTDIYGVLENDTDHRLGIEDGEAFASSLLGHYQGAVSGETRARKDKVMYASEIGKPCVRAIAYSLDPTVPREELKGATRFKFLYGNLIEEMALQLARSAGHLVTSEQKEYEYLVESNGWRVRGRNDAIIDGTMVDVKSASKFAFEKYAKEGVVPSTDTFGYAKQLQFYDWMEKKESDINNEPAFLFVNKELGKMKVVHIEPTYGDGLKLAIDNRTEILNKFVEEDILPSKISNAEVPEGASGNMKLCTACSYCGYKNECWPKARVFAYSNGPVWLTEVKREPKVMELNKYES